MNHNIKVKAFRKLHETSFFLPNVWNGMSAKIYENEGYKALATTSAGIAHSMGLPDGENLSFDALYDRVKEIMNVIEVPLSVDLERGFTKSLSELKSNVNRLLDLGIVGVNIEDGLPEEKAVDDLGDFISKIKCLNELKLGGVDFVINARLDSILLRISDDLDGIVLRAEAAFDAGADCVFIPGVLDENQVMYLREHIQGFINMYSYPSMPDLASLGINRISSGSAISREAVSHVKKVAENFDIFDVMKSGMVYPVANEMFKRDMLESMVQRFIDTHCTLDYEKGQLKIFDEPVICYAAADDELFDHMSTHYEATYNHFRTPKSWLPSGKTVISVFMPFSDVVRESNIEGKMPSREWLLARYEGQRLINDCCKSVVEHFKSLGYEAIAPPYTEDYDSNYKTVEKSKNEDYYSNWSERHVAFVAGHGTFGLSKGFITKRGMAGRFFSLITDWETIYSERNYTEIYEYCTKCGACIKQCPVNAISLENGKKHHVCSKYLDHVLEHHKPRYGCGKCQVGVPCEKKIP